MFILRYDKYKTNMLFKIIYVYKVKFNIYLDFIYIYI